jgi:hypothetical protein
MDLEHNYGAASFFKNLQARPFEYQVWVVVTAIAALRCLKAVIQDLATDSDLTGLVINILILLIFCGLCMLIYLRKIERIPLTVGVTLLILLTATYVQFGGVLGASEYNLMGLTVLFALAYNRKEVFFLMTLYVVVILVSNWDLRMGGWLTNTFFKHRSTSFDNYITTLVTLLLVILYFKKALAWESSRIHELQSKLTGQIKVIEKQKTELHEQKQLLDHINATLKADIQNHSDQIIRQNNAMQDYIWLLTESLQMPLKNLLANARDLNENSTLEVKLKQQIDELNRVVNSLIRELGHHQSRQ